MLILLLTGGCNPVVNCPNRPDSDCCATDEQCAAAYDDRPFCHGAELAVGGTCSECELDDDCAGGNCVDGAGGLRYCE